ncbi:MAG: protein kinase [Rubricoccaceae bacterium]|nr:protein kinase [Rubricoccaceae bacterium]
MSPRLSPTPIPSHPTIAGIRPFAELARGDAVVVYKGYAPERGVVLLKVLTPEAAADPALGAWLAREAAAVAAVEHPNVVALYASGQEDGRPYLVTEYVEGRSLAQALDAHGPLPPELAAWVTAETARGLGAAHAAGLLHRDLKPANVLLGDDGRVKLTDFGLATRVDTAEAAGEVRGTPGYLAPESVRGEAVGPAADLFALGAVLAEALTGRPAFPAPTVPAALDAALHHDPLPALRSDLRLPADLLDVAQQLLAREPSGRPSASAAADALDACAALRGTGFRADADALAAWLADPDAYRAARPAPPTLATAQLVAPSEPAAGADEAAASPSPERAPAADRAPAPAPRRRAAWTGGLVLGLAALAALALVALPSDPDRPTVAETDRPDSLAVTLPALPSDTLLAAAPPPPADTAPEGDAAEEPTDASREEVPPGPAPLQPSASGLPEPDALPDRTAPLPAEPADPAPGRLTVAVQPWAEVWVDGRRIGEGSLVTAQALPAGPHRVELRNPEFPVVQRQVTVEGGAEERLAVSLWEGVARLTIQVHPWAEVSVGGQALGAVPPQRQVILAPGVHPIRLTHPGLGTWTGTVTARAGETRTLRLNLADLLGGS